MSNSKTSFAINTSVYKDNDRNQFIYSINLSNPTSPTPLLFPVIVDNGSFNSFLATIYANCMKAEDFEILWENNIDLNNDKQSLYAIAVNKENEQVRFKITISKKTSNVGWLRLSDYFHETIVQNNYLKKSGCPSFKFSINNSSGDFFDFDKDSTITIQSNIEFTLKLPETRENILNMMMAFEHAKAIDSAIGYNTELDYLINEREPLYSYCPINILRLNNFKRELWKLKSHLENTFSNMSREDREKIEAGRIKELSAEATDLAYCICEEVILNIMKNGLTLSEAWQEIHCYCEYAYYEIQYGEYDSFEGLSDALLTNTWIIKGAIDTLIAESNTISDLVETLESIESSRHLGDLLPWLQNQI